MIYLMQRLRERYGALGDAYRDGKAFAVLNGPGVLKVVNSDYNAAVNALMNDPGNKQTGRSRLEKLIFRCGISDVLLSHKTLKSK